MNRLKKNEQGFGVIEIILVLIIVILLGVVGWFVYKNHNKTTNNATTTTSNTGTTPSKTTATSTQSTNNYSGWPTYSSSVLGLNIKHPPGWTVNPGTQATCTGEFFVNLLPADSEVAEAAKVTNTNLAWYSVSIDRFGTESSECAPDGNNFKGSTSSVIKSSDIIKAGVFKNDWLTFFDGSGQTRTFPDTGIVTNTQYTGASKTFIDAGTLMYGSKTYQIEINTSSFKPVQNSGPVPINISLLQRSSLYKDTLAILESIASSN